MTFIHSTRPASNKPPRPISIRLTVQLPPIVLGAGVQLLVDDLAVDRIKDDHRVILHTQAGGSIDPVTLPAGFTQAREYFVGVVATLAGQNHVEGFQFFDAVSILQWGNILAHCRALATDIGCGEEHRLDEIEILLFQHPLHEHGTDHTAPTDQTYTFHRNYTFYKKWVAWSCCCRTRRARNITDSAARRLRRRPFPAFLPWHCPPTRCRRYASPDPAPG